MDDLPAALYADPLPQALILTAIVISFGVIAFALVLLKRRTRLRAPTTWTDAEHRHMNLLSWSRPS
jgi:multisubunit Na+/H+ antiporter MnhC subunit